VIARRADSDTEPVRRTNAIATGTFIVDHAGPVLNDPSAVTEPPGAPKATPTDPGNCACSLRKLERTLPAPAVAAASPARVAASLVSSAAKRRSSITTCRSTTSRFARAVARALGRASSLGAGVDQPAPSRTPRQRSAAVPMTIRPRQRIRGLCHTRRTLRAVGLSTSSSPPNTISTREAAHTGGDGTSRRGDARRLRKQR
jgi:hypothetical protein